MSGWRALSAGHFALASCTRFSPNTRCPAAITGAIASTPNIFEIATRVTVAGSRCASAQARAISLRTSASGVFEILVAVVVMHASYPRPRPHAIRSLLQSGVRSVSITCSDYLFRLLGVVEDDAERVAMA